MNDLTPAEQSYFDSKGANPLPEVSPEPAPAAPTPTPTESHLEGGAKPPEPAPEPKTVPLQALHEAREEARATKARLEEREAAFNRLAGRLETLERIAKAPDQPQPPQGPTWDEKPIDAGKALAEKVQSLEAQQRQQAEVQAFQGALAAQENEYRKTTPDYDAAVAHLKQARASELALFGLNPAQVQAQIGREAFEIGVLAARSGKNPAEIVYTLAAQRGYKKAEPAKEPPKVDPAKALATIEKGQAAAASVAAAGGAPPTKSTLEALMDMDDAEFSAVADSDWKKIWR